MHVSACHVACMINIKWLPRLALILCRCQRRWITPSVKAESRTVTENYVRMGLHNEDEKQVMQRKKKNRNKIIAQMVKGITKF